MQLSSGQRDLKARAVHTGRSRDYPWDNVELPKQEGFLGMTIRKALGGRGRCYRDTVLVTDEMARSCPITGKVRGMKLPRTRDGYDNAPVAVR